MGELQLNTSVCLQQQMPLWDLCLPKAHLHCPCLLTWNDSNEDILLAGKTRTSHPWWKPAAHAPFLLGVSSPAAKGTTTTRISTKNWNLTISPEKVSSWVTAVKDTEELLLSASFSSLFYYTKHINLAGDHSVFQALSLDTKPVLLKTLFLLLQLHQCYPGFPLELEVSSWSQKEIDISKPIQLQNIIISSSWKWSCPIFQTVAGFL